MDDEKLCLISIALVIVMVPGLAITTYVDEEGWPWEDEKIIDEVLLIKEGDEVSVDYTGAFVGADGEQGLVFDTSVPEVARDDSIPKARSFQNKPTYDDMTFTVGSGQMIKGFDEAIRGKKEGQTFTVAIPPEKAYGIVIEELVKTINTTETMPLRETIDRETFSKLYPTVDPSRDDTFIHPFWRWDVHVVSYDPETVEIWHQPVYNKEYMGFTWNTTVVDISMERNVITLHHDITEITEDTVVPFFIMRAFDPPWADDAMGASQMEPMEGYVTSVGGTITIDYNTEVTGKTLIFQITINSIKRE